MQGHKNVIDSDSEDERILEQIRNTKVNTTKSEIVTPMAQVNSRKRLPGEIESTAEKDKSMDIETKQVRQLKFFELSDEIIFYLVDIYAFLGKLFISGVMDNGQTINIVAS
jgi:hypothetical protein